MAKVKMTECRPQMYLQLNWSAFNKNPANKTYGTYMDIKLKRNIIWWKNPALGYALSGVCKTSVKWKAQWKMWNLQKVSPHLTSSYVKGLHYNEQGA